MAVSYKMKKSAFRTIAYSYILVIRSIKANFLTNQIIDFVRYELQLCWFKAFYKFLIDNDMRFLLIHDQSTSEYNNDLVRNSGTYSHKAE